MSLAYYDDYKYLTCPASAHQHSSGAPVYLRLTGFVVNMLQETHGSQCTARWQRILRPRDALASSVRACLRPSAFPKAHVVLHLYGLSIPIE